MIIILFIFLSTCTLSFGSNLKKHTKLWTSGVFIGPITNCNKNIKYYLEPRFRLIDDKYKLEEASVYAGLGYEVTSRVILFAGLFRGAQIQTDGTTVKENRVWQQINWDVIKSKYVNLSSRTRIEERKNVAVRPIAVRFRERPMIRIPIDKCQKYFLVLFDEVFLNLNHPKWVSPRFFAENRTFIGIGIKLSKCATFDIGYMNQYQYNKTNQMSNVLYTNFNVTIE